MIALLAHHPVPWHAPLWLRLAAYWVIAAGVFLYWCYLTAEDGPADA